MAAETHAGDDGAPADGGEKGMVMVKKTVEMLMSGSVRGWQRCRRLRT